MPGESTTERNQRRIRDAAERLLSGQARLSDGRLTMKSLATEAGLPRQYLYRDPYKPLADEFDQHAKALIARTGSPDERLAEIDRLRRELKDARLQARTHRSTAQSLFEDLKIAASQIAHLTAQNEALRDQLHTASAVVPLGAPSTRRSVN
jgi:chromosome segregation ATPase